MSTPPERSDEFEELLGAVRDGRLDAEQAARLDQWLASDPAARRYYLEYITLCSTLRHYQGLLSRGVGEREEASASPAFSPPLESQQLSKDGYSPRSPFRGRPLPWLMAAAAALVAFVLAARSWRDGGRGPVAVAPPPVLADRITDGLALVVKLDQVRWEPEDRLSPVEGTVLRAGRLRLGSGRMTLAFFNGVTLTLEGPADLDLISLDRVFCRRGKLRARVPKGAEGFMVASPGSAVVDLGTEFGLNVGANGTSRLMVFEGAAEAALLDAAGASSHGQIVDQRQSFEINPGTGRIASAVAEPGGFVTTPSGPISPLMLDPGYAAAVLRSRPRSYWRFEALANGSVPNEVAGERPLRVHGPIAITADVQGRGCAEFRDGAPEQYLDTEGLWELLRDPGHAVEFWVMPEGIRYASLVGLYPPLDIVPPGQDSPYVHVFLVEQTATARWLHKPASIRFLRRWPPDIKIAYNVYSHGVSLPRRWHHVVAQKNGDRMELYFDGIPSLPLKLDFDHPTQSCYLVVGCRTPDPQDRHDNRPFVGRLDELALYDRPLSAEEIREHFRLGGQGPVAH